MSVVVDFTVPAESFALHEALAAEPSMTVEGERLASHGTEWVLPFLWASGGDLEAFYEAVANDPTVVDATVIEKADHTALYKIEWVDAVNEMVTEIVDQHANILEAVAQGEEWRLKLRFARDEQVSSFRSHFAEQGREFEVQKLYHPSVPRQQEYGLTPEQRTTLAVAQRMGYFDVPRGSSIEELADELGVSSNAVSQRIRRASTNLIQHTLTVGNDETGERA